jgi:hypothetical protein
MAKSNEQVIQEFDEAMNMTGKELREWLQTEESKSPRHEPTRRGVAGDALYGRRERSGARGRRAGGGGLRRAEQRDRAADVRLQYPALPTGGDGRTAVGGHGHRDAPCDAASVRNRGGLLEGRDTAHRKRPVAFLPAGELSLISPKCVELKFYELHHDEFSGVRNLQTTARMWPPGVQTYRALTSMLGVLQQGERGKRC